MFGRNKVSSEEYEGVKNQRDEARRLWADFSGTGEVVAANLEEMQSAGDRLNSDVKQVFENNDSLTDNTESVISRTASLLFALENIAKELTALEENNKSVKEAIEAYYKNVEGLVDDNKHFTSPSRELTEVAPKIIEESKDVRCSLSRMEDLSKQMGVLSLNAAIEAGRLGESGMDFVKAADEIRVFTNNYNEEINALKEKLDDHDKWAAELDEKLKHLISLLKDNNIATSKLIKPAGELVDLSEGSSAILSEEVSKSREELAVLKTVEEECLRLEVRNKMQLTDVIAEIEAICSNEQEIEDKLKPVFEKAGEYKVSIEKEESEREVKE